MANIATLEHLSCPVCFELPKTEVYQCRNGHPICKECSEGIQNCPQCRLCFEAKKIRNRVLESLLEIVEVKCSNYNQGCGVTLKRTDIQTHRRHCAFRAIHLCKAIGFKTCNFQSSKSWMIYNHIVDDHLAEQYISPSWRGKFYWRDFGLNLSKNLTNESSISKVWVWEAQLEDQSLAHFVILNVVQQDNYSIICINMDCFKDEDPQYLMEIDIKENAPHKNQQTRWKWTGESVHYKHAQHFAKCHPFQISMKYLALQIGGSNSDFDLAVDITVIKPMTVRSRWRWFLIYCAIVFLISSYWNGI